jgi:UDPglucose 6-dehydrogenase
VKIAVVGTGYVGLVTGACFADMGNDVTCVDIDKAKVAAMQRKQVPIYEPGLEEIFRRNIDEGRLKFTTVLSDGVAGAEVIFLALPTPPNEDGSADLSYVLGVADKLGPLLKDYAVVINKSTVPVGTSEKVKSRLAKNTKVEFDVISNPEFLREGHAIEDFQKPDRIIIGTSSARARAVMNKLYEPFVTPDSPIHFMAERPAEMTKYAANAFLAVKISFINEIANLCENLGVDVDEVRLGIGSDRRIGKQFLNAGIGYGGSCFPKDVMALQHTATENGHELAILKTVVKTNTKQQRRLLEKLKRYYGGDIRGKRFALWGLAFKPNTDDIREAPALEIIGTLCAEGATVVAFDPEAMDNVKKMFKPDSNLIYAESSYQALEGADALLIATEWPEFKNADFDKIKKALKSPVVFDGRNIYRPEVMKKHGLHYESIGRSSRVSWAAIIIATIPSMAQPFL